MEAATKNSYATSKQDCAFELFKNRCNANVLSSSSSVLTCYEPIVVKSNLTEKRTEYKAKQLTASIKSESLGNCKRDKTLTKKADDLPTQDVTYPFGDVEKEEEKHKRTIAAENTAVDEETGKLKDNTSSDSNPSYTNSKHQYNFICSKRYRENKLKYENQFKHELITSQMNARTALEAAAFIKRFGATSVPSRSQTERALKQIPKLSPEQEKRLRYLLREKQI